MLGTAFQTILAAIVAAFTGSIVEIINGFFGSLGG